ncbi:MAG: uroporphyrinogen-III C-methyltransferase [Actinomycetota bacterium]
MTVHLVGAGPGAADLLTVRASRLLARADIVVHDRLVGGDVLDLISPWAERIDVGKDPDGRSWDQAEINRLLVACAHRADCVVRLKGGDPFVFGRGSEERDELDRHGIAVEVVPGISSALAAPTAAGVPVTERSLSSGFTVLTAHQAAGTARPIDWRAAAALGTTLVILMGAARAKALSAQLICAGLAPDTPVAVITNATRPDERVEVCDLVDLGREPVANPSVIVVGEVVRARSLRPLLGASVAGAAGGEPTFREPAAVLTGGPTR